jgi:hypothetical protein
MQQWALTTPHFTLAPNTQGMVTTVNPDENCQPRPMAAAHEHIPRYNPGARCVCAMKHEGGAEWKASLGFLTQHTNLLWPL